MIPHNYHTVFELGFQSFPWTRVAKPVLFLFASIVLIRFFKKRTIYVVIAAFIGSMALIFLMISLLVYVPNFVSLRHRYVSGQTQIAEGPIENFQAAPPIGADIESFSVSGVPFHYYVGHATPCFHDSPPHRVPIREGLMVRIHYDDQCIQKVEVSEVY